MVKNNKLYSAGGLGDFFIESSKLIMENYNPKKIDVIHHDNGQMVHKQNIEYLATNLFEYKSFTWDNDLTYCDDQLSYNSRGENKYYNYSSMYKYLHQYYDGIVDPIVIQTEAGGKSVSAHKTRTWEGIDINAIIKHLSKKHQVILVGTIVPQNIDMNIEGVEYFIGRDLIQAMSIVYSAKIFLGFDGILSYVRSYTAQNQLVRFNHNYDVYYSENQRKIALPFNNSTDLLRLLKEDQLI